MNKTKAKTIAKSFIKNEMNASKSVRELTPSLKDETAIRVKATRWLKNPAVNKELTELLNLAGIGKKELANLIGELKDSKEVSKYQGKITQSKKVANDSIRIKLATLLIDKLYSTEPKTQNIFIEKYQNMDIKELKQTILKEREAQDELMSSID